MDDQQNLQELEGKNWGDPESAPTPMVARRLRLRRTPLRALTGDDLRLLIDQKIGLEYVIPKALELLCGDAMVEVGLYRGDLLSALLRVDNNYWSQNPTEREWFASLARRVVKEFGKLVRDCETFLAANR